MRHHAREPVLAVRFAPTVPSPGGMATIFVTSIVFHSLTAGAPVKESQPIVTNGPAPVPTMPPSGPTVAPPPGTVAPGASGTQLVSTVAVTAWSPVPLERHV